MAKPVGGMYVGCEVCLVPTGKVDPDCPRCGGQRGGFRPLMDDETYPPKTYPHDWYVVTQLSDPLLIVDRMWVCLKCGDVHIGAHDKDLPSVNGCDSNEAVKWSDEEENQYLLSIGAAGAD